MKQEKGVITLVPLLVLVIVLAVLYILISQGLVKSPVKVPGVTPAKKEPAVSLQTQYQNPFDKNTQYVNPFARYKNPFDNLK